ncbi:MAG: aminotransferase class I/II-fold pyridoxal phosphate-dependent enzyme, partial [Lachnospiraceae bacterium]|nr:aminotransferase class I/II-fold pyridoxal phosphate-dependent enzyme [Lachnospiraceae bacterium]
MKQIFSNRAMTFGPNIFNVLNEKKEELIKKGMKVTNLSVGTPDFAPSKAIMEAVSKASLNPDNYKYSLGDTKELTNAVIAWYKRRYNVELKADEIMSVAGTQEGMAHIALTFCNEGDVVLVPNPGYPIFETGPYLNGAKVCYYELLEENNYLIDFDSIDEEVARAAKLIIVSYPLNPTCTCADKAFYMKL